MKVNFAPGVELLVADEQLVSWEHQEAEKIILNMKDGDSIAIYEVDLMGKEIRRI